MPDGAGRVLAYAIRLVATAFESSDERDAWRTERRAIDRTKAELRSRLDSGSMIPLVVALNIRSDDVLGLDDTNAVAGAFAAMIVLSIAAFLLVPRGARVPMQWGVTGKPTWTLAPGFAVLFVPLFAAAVLAALSLLNSAARASLPSLAMLFLLIHAVHLFFAVRYARRHG